jgi:flagellar biosynthesis/type III secretory pathway M-ring protein FliF/YscJ
MEPVGSGVRPTVNPMVVRTAGMLAILLAVMLCPGTASSQTLRKRTQREVAQAANVARGALGIDEKRGDRLYVTSLPFATSNLRALAERERKKEERSRLVTSIVVNVSKGIAIVLALIVLRAVIEAIGRGVKREEEIALEARREVMEAEVVEELPETPHEILLSRIAQMIAERPEDASRLIRTMLIEGGRERAQAG